MAKFTGSSGSLFLNVYIEPGAQNIANNTTVVNWRITVSRSGAYYTYNEQGDSTLSLDLNGGRVHTSNPRWHTSGEEFQMASGSTTVGHNADGTKSFGFSATFNPNNGLHGVITVSGNISLATIPRSSSISFETGTIGSPLAITINRASTSFTHTLRWTWGNRSGTIASGLTTSASWTIPMDFCNEIPNNVSGNGTIFVDTYSGSTNIGTQSKQFTANVPDSVIPTLSSISVEEEHATAKGLNLGATTFIQIISKIKATINGAAGAYGSTIKSTLIEIEGKEISSSSNPASFTDLNFNGTVKLKASVTDSRGRKSAVKELSINLLEYFAPALSIHAYRTREYPDKIQVLRTWKIAPLSVGGVQKNKAVLKFRAAPLNSSTFVDDAGTADATWTTQISLTNSPANLSKTYATNKSWVVEGVLSDIFTGSLPSIAKSTVSTETAIHAYDKDGRFGVGKIPELGPAGSLDVAGNIYADGKQIQQHQLTLNNGRALRVTGDWNDFLATGFYIGDNLLNQPVFPGMHSWKYVRVTRDDDRYVLQEVIDFSGAVSCYRVKLENVWQPWKVYATTDHPMLQEKPIKTIRQGLPYGMKSTIVRKGDIVTISLDRNIYSVDSFEYGIMLEKIPAGYRPIVEVHMTVNTNVSQFTKSPNILHFLPDGTVRMTSNTVGIHVMTGTVTYITNDPYPS
jgi:hypothetical protein